MEASEDSKLVVKVLDQEPIGSRIDLSSIPHPDKPELQVSLTQKLSNLVQKASGRPQFDISTEEWCEKPANELIYIDFKEGDRRNPANFSRREKWIITAIACFVTLMSSSPASSYPMGLRSMLRDLNCTYIQASIGLSVYPLGFGLVPLITGSLSEEFGRRPLYIVTALISFAMYAMIGFAGNIQTVIVGRLIQGCAASTGATMVGGTIADIWSPKERGIPMAIFSLSAVGGMGVGAIIGGWIEMNPHLGWRWIQWIQMMYHAICVILVFFKTETRSEVLLARLAKKIRKETGDRRYRARVEDERPSLLMLIAISCTRPLYLTITEPIIIAFSLWIGFAWGVTYGFLSLIPVVFQDVYHFNFGEAGTTFVSIVIGSFLGVITNFYQDNLYRKNVSKRGPEARLYTACVAGILLPAGLFIFAWCSQPNVHWIVPIIGVTCFTWAMYIIFQSVFAYLSDCYGTWASSASAGQSLARNLVASAFPLFTKQMFQKLTYKWAGTLFGCLAILMIPIPFVLFFCGPAIRKRSKVASRLIVGR